MIFNDISNFTNTKDYLNILNGSINADLIIIFLAFHGVFRAMRILNADFISKKIRTLPPVGRIN